LRSVRLAAVTVLVLALCCSACGGSKERIHSLRAVEAAFSAAGAPFQGEWQPNPYLASGGSPRGELPKALGPHLVGLASTINSSTFKGGQAWVFDTQASAVAYAYLCRRRCGALIRADNVVYTGTASAAASKAMARLKG